MSESEPEVLGIVGAGGNFGREVAPWLAPQGIKEIVGYDINLDATFAKGVKRANSLAELATESDTLMLAIPFTRDGFGNMKGLQKLNPEAPIVDFTSVKVLPTLWIREWSREHGRSMDEVAMTHPLVGPHSIKEGLRGRRMYITNRPRGPIVKAYLQDLRSSGLDIKYMSADDHDREIGVPLAISHHIVHILRAAGVSVNEDLATPSTKTLADLMESADGSDALYRTLTESNPYVQSILGNFTLHALLQSQSITLPDHIREALAAA